MRTPFVAGNWKMNKTAAEARELVAALVEELPKIEGVDTALCPPAAALQTVSEMTAGSGIGVGAQNVYWESKGAYTGELSPEMVAEFCDYVIIGHSERRAYFGETDETVNKKVKAALEADLTAIVCVGETLDENQAGQTEAVVTRQVRAALDGLDALTAAAKIVIAYEPVWAIGTGLAAEPEGANAVIRDYVRGPLQDMFGEGTAQAVRVQYGGSVKPGNASDFFSQPDIDGALVGGASLKAPDFVGIVKAAAS